MRDVFLCVLLSATAEEKAIPTATPTVESIGSEHGLRVLHPEVLEAWRQVSAAMIVMDPADDICRQASEIGVLLVARLQVRGDQLVDRLRQIAQWPLPESTLRQ